MSLKNFKNKVSVLSDKEWLDLLIDSSEGKPLDIEMPGFPSDETQQAFIGASGERALLEVYPFYELVKRYCATLDVEINQDTKLLDFGCGWGRILRFFFKDFEPENIIGVDVNCDIIEFCKKNMKYGNYKTIDPLPPLDIEESSVDIITAYSVFTHLSEEAALKWVAEFHRILKPGGIVVATVWPERFLDFCERLKTVGTDSVWKKVISNAFDPIDRSRQEYRNGHFIWRGLGASSTYGDALIPYDYISKEFSKYLKVAHYFDRPAILHQALTVLKKTEESYEFNDCEFFSNAELINRHSSGKKLIGWGVSDSYHNAKDVSNFQLEYLVDSDISKQGKILDGKMIYPPDKIFSENKEDIYIIIFTSVPAYYQIMKWLKKYGYQENIHFLPIFRIFQSL